MNKKGRKKIQLYLEQHTLTLRSAKIYAPLLPQCTSTGLKTAALSTVVKLLQAELKS